MTTNIYSHQWLDQVFEQRNKKYGAYILRQHADHYTITSLLISISMVTAVLIVPVITNLLSGDVVPTLQSEPHIFTVVDPSELIPATPILPKTELPPAKLTGDIIKPMIVNSDTPVSEAQVKDLNNPNNLNASSTGNGTPNDTATGTVTGNDLPSFASADTTIYRGGVEIMPQFPGGDEAMMHFLISNLKYPQRLIDNGITCTVYLSFIVNKVGDVTGINVLRGVQESKDFENEASRVVALMPKWKPGRQNGQNVSVYFTLPVRFSLQ